MKRSKTITFLVAGFSAGIMFIGSCIGGSSDTPTAAQDSYRVTPGKQLAVASPGLLENDSAGFWVESFDASSHYGGTVVVDADGGFQYAPPSGTFVGQDKFTYTATDGEILQICTVLIRVARLQCSELTKVLSSDTQAYDEFGWAVAISGDIAVVGAHREDTGAYDAGAAYVFERDASGNWLEADKLIASDAENEGYFGQSVAVSGDIAVVGAYWEGLGGNAPGAAYVFEKDASGNWLEAAKLVSSDAENGDYFGQNVAVSGDIVVAGAHLEDTGGFYAGAAYIFERDASGNWLEVIKLIASDADNNDQFGRSVAVSGDIAVVGAPGEATGGPGAGAAYTFERDESDNWIETGKLTASDAETGDWFGRSVAVSGGAIVVGAELEATHGNRAGAAYVFEPNTSGTWIETAKLNASDAEAVDFFGKSVAISGDMAVVGAYDEDTGGLGAGAAYVFERGASGNWSEAQKITALDAEAYDYFGLSVAVSGDTVVVGAFDEDTGGINAGAAYIYNLY